MEAGITTDDLLIGAYRVHCQAYKRGFTVRQIVAEMLGKKTGATEGKGGSMHFYSK
jgi:pyruvate dehydrogenase E1 component alpha subunit